MEAQREPHLHWVDALKVLVVGGIAVFHACLVFSGRPWLVNNARPSVLMAAFAAFTFQWGLSLLFALSGAATYFGLRGRSGSELIALRWRGFGLPLVLGVAILSPLQFMVATHEPLDAGSYVSWLQSRQLGPHLSSMAGTVYHLWFLVFLLLISTACVPLLARLRTPVGRAAAGAIATRSGGAFGFLVLSVPLVLVAVGLQPLFPTFEDWGDLARQAVVFMLGALLVSDGRFSRGLRRQAWPSLATGLAATAALGLLAAANPAGLAVPGYTWFSVAFAGVGAVNTWSWVTFFMAFGVRLLNGAATWPSRLGELTLPFYILHHPVLVIAATGAVGLPIGPWPKLGLILLVTYTVTGALCAIVDRHRELRTLFGMHRAAPVRLPA